MKYILLLAFLFTASVAFSQEKFLYTFFYNKYDFYNPEKNKMAIINRPAFYLELYSQKKSTESPGDHDDTPFGFDTLTIVIEEKIYARPFYYIDYGITKLKLNPKDYHSVHKMYIYKDGTYKLSFYDDKKNLLAFDVIIVQQ